jgi:hypothetical protein
MFNPSLFTLRVGNLPSCFLYLSVPVVKDLLLQNLTNIATLPTGVNTF